MAASAIGIDIGGTSIKGGVVDLATGKLVGESAVVLTPAGGEPDEIVRATVGLIRWLEAGQSRTEVVGIAFPAVVTTEGVTRSAANVSERWVGLQAKLLFERSLGRHVEILNDADAAGMAESRFGVAWGLPGSVLIVTLGTGIGTALVHDGRLVPNLELGHIEIFGVDWESRAAASVKTSESLSWEEWAARLQIYLERVEDLLGPDLIVLGGAISADAEHFLPLLRTRARLVPADLRKEAGIIGAAVFAAERGERQTASLVAS